MPKVQCIVGLGNPGSEYETTRHNAGAWFLQRLASAHGVTLKNEKKFQGMHATLRIDDHNCQLLLPTTFMNCSGQSLQALLKFYKIPLDAVLVAHDELDLPPGSAKLKIGGGHAGHNGLRDIINKCGGNGFVRLRLGIGHPGNKKLVHDYVLHKPSNADKLKILEAVEDGLAQVPYLLDGEIERAMTRLHTEAG